MKRIAAAFFLTPLLASSMFGMLGVVAFPFMLSVSLLIAVPLFILLKGVRRLDWWHALLAGVLCGVSFAALDSAGSSLDRLVSPNNVYYVGLGAVVGFAFWWIGVFRNPALPFVARRFPWSSLLIVPIIALGFWVHHALRSSFHEGRVLAVLKEPAQASESGEVSVRLSDGLTVPAAFGNTWPRPMIVGKCFHVEQRWSTLRFRRVYELSGPFGAGGDIC